LGFINFNGMDMADRLNEDLTSKLFSKAESNKLALGMQEHLTDYNASITKINALSNKFKGIGNQGLKLTPANGAQWARDLSSIKGCLVSLNEHHNKIMEEENVINRIETKAAWRNLLFRIGTTAAVALTIGIAYSIAGNVDSFYLPLQQKTVTYYYEGKHHAIPPSDPSKYEEPKKVVTVTGASKGNPIAMPSPKTFAVAGEPKL
jgi:hypothetical protein